MVEGERPLRLFVAFDVPSTLQGQLDSVVDTMRDGLAGARWIEASRRHVTLKFLGSTAPGLLPEVQAACGLAAAKHSRSEVALDSLGAFPSLGRARMLWVGLSDPARVTASLATVLDEALEPLGVEREQRAFTPHLTLARFKTPRSLTGKLPELGSEALRPWPLAEIVLYRSHLSPKGATYEALSRYPLA